VYVHRTLGYGHIVTSQKTREDVNGTEVNLRQRSKRVFHTWTPENAFRTGITAPLFAIRSQLSAAYTYYTHLYVFEEYTRSCLSVIAAARPSSMECAHNLWISNRIFREISFDQPIVASAFYARRHHRIRIERFDQVRRWVSWVRAKVLGVCRHRHRDRIPHACPTWDGTSDPVSHTRAWIIFEYIFTFFFFFYYYSIKNRFFVYSTRSYATRFCSTIGRLVPPSDGR
jgi:hypothetical protein